MRDRMASRGPDDATTYKFRNIIFAHRRLAIRDKAGGKQPILSPSGRYVFSYNGEIYNDAALREELRAAGYTFKTHCDTETLATAWQEWGPECVSKLRGMFAFGVYDFHEQELTLVRDRFGVKPLFWSSVNNEIVFASTIAAIRQHPKFSSQPDLATLRHYMSTLRLTFGEQTVFSGISAVQPAQMVSFKAGQIRKSTYWTAPTSDETSDIGFEEAVDELQSTLREAVAIRLISDVPVGMMLSGGVDSNSLAYMIKGETNSAFDARCGGGTDEAFPTDGSDFEFAKACAEENGLNYEEVKLDSDTYLSGWQRLVTEYETPVSTPTDTIINHLARNLKQTVGVALGGEGADEACCGYQVPHWSGADFDLLKSMGSLDASNAEIAASSLQRQYGDHAPSTPGELYLACNGLIPISAQRCLMHSSLWSDTDDHVVRNYYDARFAELEGMQTTEKTAHILMRSNLENLLSRLDSATMLEGLESRVPYADHILVERLFRLPMSYRIDVCPDEQTPWRSSLDLAQRGSLRPKRLIHALADRLMPAKLARRPKASFPTPLPIWLHGTWKSWLDSKLLNSEFARAVFDPSALRQLTEMPAQLSMWKWPVVNIALWGDLCFS